MTRMVSEATASHKPFIAVSVQYRLNIFAHGSDPSSQNLALSDQILAINWIVMHIADFGGDPVSTATRCTKVVV